MLVLTITKDIPEIPW